MTETEKNDFILANWRKMPKKQMCQTMKIGYATFEKMWYQLATQGLIPKVRQLDKQYAAHMKPVLTDEQIIRYIVERNGTTTKTDMIADLTVCARRFRQIYKEVADAGLIVPRVHGGIFDPSKKKARPKRKKITFDEYPRVMVMPWVPSKWVNQSAKWRGTYASGMRV